MNKTEFIKELKIKLKNFPSEELNDALSYYNEYFEDAQIDDTVDVEKELGSPSMVASQILSDYAVKDIKIKDKPSKNRISSIWFIILAIFAAPIALPLSFAMVILVGTLVFTIGSIVFSFGLCSVSILFSGILVFGTGLLSIISNFSSALLFMGVGLLLSGIGLLAFAGTFKFGNVVLKSILNLSNNLLKKINKNKR
ncbi:DUF1700 domain-containing protein [Romboutsia sedimentorum]|uniref:DUF1700 domain-containing protein n=1 Tax=Romboutsia sedimentorum TaxID=1368474 RepID=A0ABT7E5C1_9FIRM|nr:DUF1700 domain-containing protein [Romboutsia sedimentorum]MDK2562125.1 DUF1700 domain-containing protein [Romboutsia sedimentorum]MDK2584363.1 DUF1700 domain-containing protein [Romboutsia sedimentorum]